MPLSRLFVTVLSLLLLTSLANAQQPKRVDLYVAETAGIRRGGFPVHARAPFPHGALAQPSNARVMLNGMEVPGQYRAESLWPDGSVQWLDIDFNAAIGPKESRTYQIEYGPDVKPAATPRGLTVTEDADAIQIGNVRFSKTGVPLLASVKYRNEDISKGANGIAVIDSAGKSFDLSSAEAVKAEVVKRGPLFVVVRYTGRIPLDSQYSVPFSLDLEMPSGKTMVTISATVKDPAKRLREIALDTPLSFGPLPWVWDFGTEHWTYGSIRNENDSVILSETYKRGGAADWQVVSGPKGKEQPYEVGSAAARFVDWGHIQDGKEAVAFGIDPSAAQPGTYRVSMNGSGQISFRFAEVAPAAELTLRIFEHFVTSPVQIGAVTSPASLLNPLTAECDRRQYMESGVPVPPGIGKR